MGKKKSLTHQQKADRLLQLIDLTGLNYLGFEILLGYKSEGKYLHQIKNGTKAISIFMVKRIETTFGFEEGTFLNLSVEFNIVNITNTLNRFKSDHPKHTDYFLSEDEVYLVIKILIKEGYFNDKKSGEEILQKINDMGYSYSSEVLSGKLVNLVKRNFLKAEKRNMILKNGEIGKKKVNYYWC